MSVFARNPETGSFEFLSADVVLTPVDTDVFLRMLNNELGRSQLAVKRAREAELNAERTYMEARTRILLDEDAPEVGRRAGQVSQKEQDSWFAERIPAPFWALREARITRANAVDYAWQVKAQVELMRSLNVNAKAMYDTYRGGGR